MEHAQNVIPTESARELYLRLREVWSAETSADENWTSVRPELGQCAVTSLIVQDRLGGVLLRSVVNGVSHYWNKIASGLEVDLTLAQFDVPVTYSEVAVVR